MSDPDLAVLKITLDPASTEGIVHYVFETAGSEPRCLKLAVQRSSELGIPNWLLPQKASDGAFTFRLPGELCNRLAHQLDATHEPGRTLWLHLDEPYGYLGLVPWERLLADGNLQHPVLRLPEVSLGRRAGRRLDIVICVNAPFQDTRLQAVLDRATLLRKVAAEATWRLSGAVEFLSHVGRLWGSLTALLDAVVDESPLPVRLHVFATSKWYYFLRGLARQRGWDDDQVTFYEPRKADPFDEMGPQSSTGKGGRAPRWSRAAVRDPWLRLILGEIDSTVDAVHFVCNGGVAFNRGAATFGPMPGDPLRSWSSVSPMQMSSFLALLGSPVVGFSSPPDDPATAGLRFFADGLARLRPGPVLYHEMGTEAGANVVGTAYRLLFSPVQLDPPEIADGFLYADPSYVRDEPDVKRVSNLYAAMDTEGGQLADDSPRWATAVQSYVDRRRMVMTEWELGDRGDPVSASHRAQQAGIADALNWASSELVSDYVAKPPPASNDQGGSA